jgi:hypothetical protein
LIKPISFYPIVQRIATRLARFSTYSHVARAACVPVSFLCLMGAVAAD